MTSIAMGWSTLHTTTMEDISSDKGAEDEMEVGDQGDSTLLFTTYVGNDTIILS